MLMMLKRLLLCLLMVALFAGTPGTSLAQQGKTFEPGSLIIPTDVLYQNEGRFKAFGLVYHLLEEGIPIRWVIKFGEG